MMLPRRVLEKGNCRRGSATGSEEGADHGPIILTSPMPMPSRLRMSL